jgi:hypothetical protein
MEETAQNFENGVLLTNLRFSLPFQNFMSHIEIMKFCQNHWSLMSMDQLGNRVGVWGEALQQASGQKHKDDVNGFASYGIPLATCSS